MAFPGANSSATDRPAADAPGTDAPAPGAQQQDTPPLAPAEQGQSPWWSAPAGKPFGIPDFAHGFAALFAFLLPTPHPIAVHVKARRS